jgi:hypothetical protein
VNCYYFTTTLLLLCYYFTTTLLLLQVQCNVELVTTTLLLFCYYFTTMLLLLQGKLGELAAALGAIEQMHTVVCQPQVGIAQGIGITLEEAEGKEGCKVGSTCICMIYRDMTHT